MHYICISVRGGQPLLLVSPSLGKTHTLTLTEQQGSPLPLTDKTHINLRTACTNYVCSLFDTTHNHLLTYVRMQRKWIQWVRNHIGPLERTPPSPSSPDPSGRLQGTGPAQQHILSYVQQTTICHYI